MYLDVDADEWAFLEEIRSGPDDETPRMVYADWLEARGDARADYLRLEQWLPRLEPGSEDRLDAQRRLRDLAQRLPAAWVASVARVPIENCERQALRFKFQCPMKWEQLRPTDDAGVRVCEVCREQVYYCDSIDAARGHASRGRCVAVDASVVRGDNDLEPPMVEMVDMLLGEVVAYEDEADPARRPTRRQRGRNPRRGS